SANDWGPLSRRGLRRGASYAPRDVDGIVLSKLLGVKREQISPSMTALTFGSAAVICFSSSAGNSLDRRGRPQFKNLMFRRGNPPCFFAFDLLTYGKDLRTERLL